MPGGTQKAFRSPFSFSTKCEVSQSHRCHCDKHLGDAARLPVAGGDQAQPPPSPPGDHTLSPRETISKLNLRLWSYNMKTLPNTLYSSGTS